MTFNLKFHTLHNVCQKFVYIFNTQNGKPIMRELCAQRVLQHLHDKQHARDKPIKDTTIKSEFFKISYTAYFIPYWFWLTLSIKSINTNYNTQVKTGLLFWGKFWYWLVTCRVWIIWMNEEQYGTQQIIAFYCYSCQETC